MKNLRFNRRKENKKTRAEINEKETEETTAKVNKTKSWFSEKINRQTTSQTHREKKGEESTKLEMKMEKSQQNTQSHQRLLISNCMTI